MTSILDVEETLEKLKLSQKIKLLGGLDLWHTEPVPEAGVPSMRFSDGPNGVRGTQFFNGVRASCFPASTGLGSAFDVELAAKVGEALADEAKAKSAHVLLAPTVNIQRSPLGGRSFESFSEDPHLNGTIAAAYINGLQKKGVSATIKHFVANDQEFERFSISSDVSERALREIYLKPFQIAIKHSDPWAAMSSYNRVNGVHVSEDKRLLDDILRKEWGWKGLVMSDWTGVYSTTQSILAGLDIEMPGPPIMRGKAIERALQAGKLFPSDIDARARKVLELVQRAQASGIPFDGPEAAIDTPEVRQILRTAAADATVLLKNDSKLLPLKAGDVKTIAVLGPNAKAAMVSGGGSASLTPTYTVSPLAGITTAAKEIGAKVRYTPGAYTTKYHPLLDAYIRQPDETPGALVEFWNEPPTSDFLALQPSFVDPLAKCTWSTPTLSSYCFLADNIDEKVNLACWIRYSTVFIPDEDGDWEFGVNLTGKANLFFDNNLVVDLSTVESHSDVWFGLGTDDLRGSVTGLKAGQAYPVEVRMSNVDFVSQGIPFTACRGGIRIGAIKKIDPQGALNDAVELAKTSDVAVVVVGLNNDWESEGFDRTDLELPGLSNSLVSAVLKANPRTIIVNQSGAPVTMPWVNDAATLVQAFYGGNELGNGLADVLFGKVNPSGKLSLTFPKRLEDVPSYPSYSNKGQEHGKILYNEGIFVGYRGYEIKNVEALFPFGYGLSYSSFEYSALEVTSLSDEAECTVTFKITNVSHEDGREVAQVYVADPVSSLPRAVKELKGFAKTLVKAGQTESVSVKLDREAFGFYDDRQSSWIAEKGKFEILVGASSADIKLKTEVELEKTITWTGL